MQEAVSEIQSQETASQIRLSHREQRSAQKQLQKTTAKENSIGFEQSVPRENGKKETEGGIAIAIVDIA